MINQEEKDVVEGVTVLTLDLATEVTDVANALMILEKSDLVRENLEKGDVLQRLVTQAQTDQDVLEDSDFKAS